MKILIVEDDNSTRLFLETVVKSCGHEPESFSNAEEGWAAYQKEDFQIAILDWILPGMSGLDLCRKIRNLPNGKNTIILVATVKDKPNDLQAVLDAGADDYLTKPVEASLLKIRLEIAKRDAEKLSEKKICENRMLQTEKLVSLQVMVSGIAHELNNPLQGILGLSEILALETENPDKKEAMLDVVSLAQRCRTIVNDLLQFSDQEESEQESIDIHNILDRFLEMWKSNLSKEKIEIKQKYIEGKIFIKGNKAQLTQVFFNLCQNAVQAMNREGTLVVSTKLINGKKENYIDIEFTDTGIGISSDKLAQVFDPFFTTKEVGVGTGLGLSVCHGIIEQHKGNIMIESEGKGKGTKVILRLPVAQEEQIFLKSA